MPAVCLLAGLPLSAQSGDGRIEIPADQIPCICPSGGPGSISVMAEGSAGPFTFLWSGPGGYASTEQNPDDLPAPGQYSVVVTNAYGCAVTLEAEVPACDPIQIEAPHILYHPSSCSASDGVIRWFSGNVVSGGSAPYTFAWSSGHTSLFLTDLAPGAYMLTITDSKGCTASFTYSLDSQDTPDPIIGVTGACEGRNEGAVIVGALSTGGQAAEFDFTWSNGVVDLQTSISEQTGLAAGTYTVTITESNTGCSIVEHIVVPELVPSGPLSIAGQVSYSCSGGAISIDITGGVGPYSIAWPGGNIDMTSINHLSSGSHCVTVTDFCGVVATACFEVAATQNPLFHIGVPFLQHVSSAEGQNGSISIAPFPAGNYTFQWSTGSTSHVISGLGAGSYSVTVTNQATECTQIRTFVIKNCDKPKELDVIVIPEFLSLTGAGARYRAMIRDEAGNYSGFFPQEYQVTWVTPVSNQEVLGNSSILDLPSGYPHNEVWLRVTNGCESILVRKPVIRCTDQPNNQSLADFFILQRSNPCAGFQDGEVVLSIPLEPGELFTVLLNGEPLTTSPAENILHIGGLPGKTPQTVEVIVGDCHFEFTFSLQEEPFRREFAGLDGDICVYGEYCKEHYLSNDDFPDFRAASTIDYSTGSGLGFVGSSCIATRVCPVGIAAGTATFKKRTARMMEYVAALFTAAQSDMNGLYGNTFDNIMYHLGPGFWVGKECRSMRFCDKTLWPLSDSPVALSALAQSSGEIVPSNREGCTDKVKCGIWTYHVCREKYEKFLAGPPPINTVENCLPIRANAYILYRNLTYLRNYFTEFTGSGLENFLTEHQNNPALICATVIFCATNFSVIASDIGSVICEQPVINCAGEIIGYTCQFTPSEYASSLGRALCNPKTQFGSGSCNPPVIIRFNLIQDCGPLVPDPPDPDPVDPPIPSPAPNQNLMKFSSNVCDEPGIWANPDDPQLFKVFLDAYQEESLRGFGFAQSLEAVNPKGLIGTEQGFTVDDFDPLGERIFKQRADTVLVQYVEDWEKELTAYVQELIPGQKYRLMYEDTAATWSKRIQSGDRLYVSHFSVSQSNVDEMIIGGEFAGALTWEDDLIAQSDTQSGFVLRIGFDGQVLALTRITGLSRPVFSENRNNSLVVGGNYTGPINIGGHPQSTTLNGNGFVFLEIDEYNEAQYLSSIAITAGYVELSDITTSYDTAFERVAILLNGNFSAIVDNAAVSTSGEEALQIVILNSSGNYLHHKNLPAVQIAHQPDMAYGARNELYLGLTFSDSLLIDNQLFESAGGEDILLLRFSTDGVLNWSRQYGDTENQTVSKIFYDREALCFGGTFQGSVGDKIIGKYIFSNLSPVQSRAYISFVLPNEITGVQELAEVQGQETGAAYLDRIQKERDGDIRIFPNPFRESIFISITGNPASQLTITNVMGQTLMQFAPALPFSETEIDTSLLAPGIYFIRLSDGRGNLLGARKIVKSRP